MEIEVVLQVLQATAYSVTLEATYPSVLTFSHVNMIFHFEYNPLTLLTYEERHLNVSFVAASEIPDRKEDDNAFNISVPVVSRVDLYTEGVSAPDNVEARINETLSLQQVVNVSQLAINRTQIGPQTTHLFTMEIRVPLEAPNGLPLLYLVDNPIMSPSLTCSPVPLNPRKFNVRRSKREVEKQVDDGEGGDGDLDEGTTTPSPPTSLPDGGNGQTTSASGDTTRQTEADKKKMVLDCNKIKCQVIRCNVTSLFPDETVYLQFTTYITTATIKFIGYTSVALESSLIIETTWVLQAQEAESGPKGDDETESETQDAVLGVGQRSQKRFEVSVGDDVCVV
ncbi:integrin alpha 5 [Penaeus vannamei]|uniref:Integrin alpha 5 n=1 Tax=Penaeus vannamei TaxID=6689 RepID=A0A3R7QJP4_PENVA|nr:integrin alpha 5 [Penaeus vannamei]